MDRQDIDALLIGALYGELTPAEEAQLDAHLESHPADRQALDDLTAARTAIRDSRVFATLLDPPQAVSALLLQEAARRSPRPARRESAEHDGWFARLRRSFMAHPAMAAAAMLVLCVGVAGSMYLRHGNKSFSEAQVAPAQLADAERAAATSTESTISMGAASQSPQSPQSQGRMIGGAAAGSGAPSDVATGAVTTPPAAAPAIAYQAGLADAQAGPGTAQLAEGRKGDSGNGLGRAAPDGFLDGRSGLRRGVAPPARASKLVVHRDLPEVKELDAPLRYAPKKDVDGDDDGVASSRHGAAGGGIASTGAAPGAAPNAAREDRSANTPPPPPPVAPPATKTVSKASTKPAPAATPAQLAADKAEAQESADSSKKKQAAQSANDAWAHDQHQRLQQLVRAGNCTDAAPLAIAIANRAPDYYAANIATDRNIKQCLAYINDARDKDAEHSGKARAKRVDSVETPQPAPAQDAK
jgi:hypothetical protein